MAERAEQKSWTAVQWQYEPSVMVDRMHPITIDAVRDLQNIVRYAVRQAGECLSKTGEWEYEPMPSSRDDNFFSRFRFETWEEAAKTVEKFCSNGKGRFE